MPNPIPRNRSAGGRRPRRPGRHQAAPSLPFRRLLENIRRLGPPQPTPTRSGTNIAVGVIFCAVAALVVWVVLPSYPLGTSTGSTAAPPKRDHAGPTTVGNGTPGPVDDQLAAQPGGSAGLDRGPTPEVEARTDWAEGHRAVGFPVAPAAKRQPAPATQPPPTQPPPTQPNPTARPSPTAQLARPSEPTDVADPRPSVDPQTEDPPQWRPVPSRQPHRPQEPVRPREPQTTPSEPRVASNAEHEQLRDRLGSLADQLTQRAKDRGGDAGIGQGAVPFAGH